MDEVWIAMPPKPSVPEPAQPIQFAPLSVPELVSHSAAESEDNEALSVAPQPVSPELRTKLDALPKDPGCYIFRDRDRKVIYVGKAISLRPRVRSYFSGAPDDRLLSSILRRHIADVETVVTPSELDALVLENNLIKKFRPRFNLRLKDDKNYLSVRLSIKDTYPRIYFVRKPKKDGAQYFGPYTSAGAIRQTLETLRPVFPLRLCSDQTLANRSRPCIYHDIGYCCAPCVGKVSPEQYRTIVEGLAHFLKGKDTRIIDELKRQMAHHSQALEFEQAAKVRDQIARLERVAEQQKVQTGDFADRDVVGVYRAGTDDIAIHVLFYRDGKLINSVSHEFQNPLPDHEVLRQFVVQFYATGGREIPKEIVTALPLDEAEGLAAYFSKRAGYAVTLKTPSRGLLQSLVEMANANARYAHKDVLQLKQREETLLSQLQAKLGLKNFPDRMECFDISTLQGTATVGSQVTFLHGRPEKAEYKRYRIAPEHAGNDFDAMAEMLARRIRRSKEENDPLPDVVILDGGEPQLARVAALFEEHGVIECDLIALAKSRPVKGRFQATPERVFKPGLDAPIVLKKGAPETYLMQRIRDEAHRFAITYHRKLRQQEALKTGLEGVKGLGDKRRHALLMHFGTQAAIREATAADLVEVPGISPALAARIVEHLNSPP